MNLEGSSSIVTGGESGIGEAGARQLVAASEMGPLRALVNSAGLGYAGRTIDRNNVPIYGQGEGSQPFKARLGESVLFPKRLGSGEELAFAVMEHITNPYLNGETIRVDGGIRMPPK